MSVADLGLLGSSQNKAAGTTLAVTNTSGAIIPAGTLLVLALTEDNPASTTAPTLTVANTGSDVWVRSFTPAIGSGVTTTAGAGIWHQTWYVKTTADIAVGATITTITTTSVVAKAAAITGYSGASATLRGTPVTGTSTAGTPSVTTGTAPVAGDLVVGTIGGENSAQATGDADTTNGSWGAIAGIATSGSTAATNVATGIQAKIVTAGGNQTYNPTTANDAVASVMVFQPGPATGTASGTRTWTGAATGSAPATGGGSAPTVTSLVAVGTNAAGATKTSASFTPPANCKLLAVGWVQSAIGVNGANGDLSITDSLATHLTWTRPVTEFYLPTEFSTALHVWEASVGASPSAMTVSMTNSNLQGSGGSAIAMMVVAVSGGQIKAGQIDLNIVGTTSGATITAGPLPASATSGNLTLCLEAFNTDQGVAAGTPSGFTSLAVDAGPFEGVRVTSSTTFAATSTTYASTPDQFGHGTVLVEYQSTASLPGSGTGSGTWSFAGTATGSRPAKGAGSGTWSFAGASVGRSVTGGAGSGTWSFAGAATGKRSPKAAHAGSWNYTGFAGTPRDLWFKDGSGSRIFLMSAEDWGLLPNAVLNSTDPRTTWHSYFSARQAQGYNGIEVCLFGYGSQMGFGLASPTTPEGGDPDAGGAVYPFNTNSNNPLNANNSVWWQRRADFFTIAASYGFMVLMNVTTPNMGQNSFTRDWSVAQWQAFGTKLGTAFASVPNVYWMFCDDYFGDRDTEITACLTNMRAAGANQPVSIQYQAETDSRREMSSGTVQPWGDTYADFYFGYSYNPGYDVVEYAGLEPTPKPYGFFDGQFIQSSVLGGWANDDTDMLRRIVWQSLASGAKAIQVGDNDMWTWPASALAAVTAKHFYTNQVPAISAFFRSLPNWWELKADTSSVLVTSGRGTHVGHIVAGDSANYYDGDRDNYVPAAFIQTGANAGKLALIYMIKATTITIDQSKLVANYQAYWVDPANGTKTLTTKGSSYTKPSTLNSRNDTDWALLLTEPPAPGAGVGSGTWSFSGAGTGKAGPGYGNAAGTFSFAGAGTGKRSPKGVNSATWSYTGAAVGSAGQGGSASGTWTFTGAAAGSRTPKATGSGTWSFAGTAGGKTFYRGTTAGTWTFAGSSAGKRTPKATSTGTFTFAGTSALGKSTPAGTAGGTWSFTGAAAGKRTPKANGTGTFTYAGSAVSTTASAGTASGTWAFTGTATGKRTPKATTAGGFSWAGTGTGYRSPKASTSGTYTRVGTASGIAGTVVPFSGWGIQI